MTVKPKAADMHNALTYDFDQLTPDSATVVMEWEKVGVPFKVSVDVHSVVEASLKKQLRNLSQYTWQSWDDAASYLLAEKVALDDALKYAEKSIQNEDRFDNETTKSKVLIALNRKDEAVGCPEKGAGTGHAAPDPYLCSSIDGGKAQRRSLRHFRENAQKHPEQWFVHTGLARMYSAQGKFDDATREMKLSLATAPSEQKSYLDGLEKKLESRQDINQ